MLWMLVIMYLNRAAIKENHLFVIYKNLGLKAVWMNWSWRINCKLADSKSCGTLNFLSHFPYFEICVGEKFVCPIIQYLKSNVKSGFEKPSQKEILYLVQKPV